MPVCVCATRLEHFTASHGGVTVKRGTWGQEAGEIYEKKTNLGTFISDRFGSKGASFCETKVRHLLCELMT